MRPADWLDTRPKKVAFLGLGVSRMAYGEHLCATELAERWDQVWACNFAMSLYRHDVVWLMDDMRTQAARMPGYGYAMATHDRLPDEWLHHRTLPLLTGLCRCILSTAVAPL